MQIKWTVLVFKRYIALSVIVAAMTLMHANQVFAHASLVKAEPARRAVLSTPPARIHLWFNEEIEPAYAALTVLNADKKPITDNKVEVDSKDPKSVVLELPDMQPGRYTVKFRVLSIDGHVVDSEYNFTVANEKK